MKRIGCFLAKRERNCCGRCQTKPQRRWLKTTMPYASAKRSRVVADAPAASESSSVEMPASLPDATVATSPLPLPLCFPLPFPFPLVRAVAIPAGRSPGVRLDVPTEADCEPICELTGEVTGDADAAG